MNSSYRYENTSSLGKLRYFWTEYRGNSRFGQGFWGDWACGKRGRNSRRALFNADIDVDLRILRIAAALIVNFEVGFICSSTTKLCLIFQTPNFLPCLRHDVLHWPSCAGNDG